jgi:hypothetical protein
MCDFAAAAQLTARAAAAKCWNMLNLLKRRAIPLPRETPFPL